MESQSQTIPRRSLPRRLLNRLEIDQAVFFSIASRAWQFLAGPISILIIAACLTPEVQGYYYTFASLMGMQSLVELGLHTVIISVSSHEWSRLQLQADGTVTGDEGALHRLSGLKRFVSQWYAGMALIFTMACGLGGWLFLKQQPSAGIDWEAPWYCVVVLNGLVLWAWAFTAMLEGCNQMRVVNRVRLIQFVTGSLAVWGSMELGFGLWATVVSVAVRLLWDFWLVCIRYRKFWHSLLSQPDDKAISWKREIWPLQWKLAISGVAGYLAFSLLTPVMFDVHGAIVAGQTGMTWSILTAIEAAANSWIVARAPLLGMIAARRDWKEMDRVFRRLALISWCFHFLALVGVCGGVWLMNVLPFDLAHRCASRMLALQPTATFGCAFLLLHLPRCQSVYIRAHKQDPFLIASVVSHGLIAALVVLLGTAFGPIGAALGLLSVVSLVIVPWWQWIWIRCRREWHRPEIS